MQKPLTQAMARGLLEPGFEHIRPTPLGRRFLNELVVLFLPETTHRDAQVPREAGYRERPTR
jgi:hypothetical protein